MKKTISLLFIVIFIGILINFNFFNQKTIDSLLILTGFSAEETALEEIAPSNLFIDPEKHYVGWSNSKPNINFTQVFKGEINEYGRASGFYSRPGGNDPEGARLKRQTNIKNLAGVYSAEVEIYSPVNKRWIKKSSTFFPDHMSKSDVTKSIVQAWNERDTHYKTPAWRGPSGHGFDIEGYISKHNGGINSAHPIYIKN